jgi:hypothetical protein
MARRRSWTVEPRVDGTWAVRRRGSSRADSVHETKDAAIARAVSLCKRDRGDLCIKNLAGDVDDARSYGHLYRYGGQPGTLEHLRAARRTAR